MSLCLQNFSNSLSVKIIMYYCHSLSYIRATNPVTQSSKQFRFSNKTLLKYIPGIGQDDLFAGSCGWRALGLFHRHQVADIGQHRLQVGHFGSRCVCLLVGFVRLIGSTGETTNFLEARAISEHGDESNRQLGNNPCWMEITFYAEYESSSS